MPAKVCLTMIVRNESGTIARCVRAVAPHVDCYVLLDTGSTDGTVAIVERMMAQAGVPGLVVNREFYDVEQARNDALDAARAADFDFDYLMLATPTWIARRGRGLARSTDHQPGGETARR